MSNSFHEERPKFEGCEDRIFQCQGLADKFMVPRRLTGLANCVVSCKVVDNYCSITLWRPAER